MVVSMLCAAIRGYLWVKLDGFKISPENESQQSKSCGIHCLKKLNSRFCVSISFQKHVNKHFWQRLLFG